MPRKLPLRHQQCGQRWWDIVLMNNTIVWCTYWYVLYCFASPHMQSVTDPAASQEPFSCELTLLVIFMLYAHLRLHPASSCMVTGVCCFVVVTTMLLECTSNKYTSTHSLVSDRKGKSSSSQPRAKWSKLVSHCTNEEHYCVMYVLVCAVLFCFPSHAVRDWCNGFPRISFLWVDPYQCTGYTAQTAPRGGRTRCAPRCTVVSTIDCIACQMRELRSMITLQNSMLQIGKYDAENGMIRATSLVAQPWTWNNGFKFRMQKIVNFRTTALNHQSTKFSFSPIYSCISGHTVWVWG